MLVVVLMVVGWHAGDAGGGVAEFVQAEALTGVRICIPLSYQVCKVCHAARMIPGMSVWSRYGNVHD